MIGFDTTAGEIGFNSDAEGATAPETLRQTDRRSDSNFWRETPFEVSADGIILSGKWTEGAHV
jgi:hypothetical protein